MSTEKPIREEVREITKEEERDSLIWALFQIASFEDFYEAWEGEFRNVDHLEERLKRLDVDEAIRLVKREIVFSRRKQIGGNNE